LILLDSSLVEKFSRKDYLLLHDDISTATASRDLEYGVKQNIIKQDGSKNQARYLFVNEDELSN
jgi:hypothetical protein